MAKKALVASKSGTAMYYGQSVMVEALWSTTADIKVNGVHKRVPRHLLSEVSMLPRIEYRDPPADTARRSNE